MMKLAIVHGFQKIADELSQQFNALEEKVDRELKEAVDYLPILLEFESIP